MDRRLLMLSLGMFAIGTDNFVVAGILPGVADSLHTTVGLAGQMVTVYALSYAVMAPVMAAAAGSWSRKTLLISALGIFIVGNVITALATDLTTVLISRALAGLGAAMFALTAVGVAAVLGDPARRGRALATVTAGLAAATALGSPVGTFIGGLGGWRSTLWFVAGLGAVSLAGIGALLHDIPQPARVNLRDRLAPLGNRRVALILLTSLFAFGGFLMVYTYAGLVLLPVTGGDARTLAGLLLVWGIAATAGNLVAGHLVDRFDTGKIVTISLIVAIINFCALPWTSLHLSTTLVALTIWGLIGWGLIVPQQHRLVALAPATAPLLLALNNTATYAGLASAGVLGGVVLLHVDARFLSWIGAGLITVALVLAVMTSARSARQTDATMRQRPSLPDPAQH